MQSPAKPRLKKLHPKQALPSKHLIAGARYLREKKELYEKINNDCSAHIGGRDGVCRFEFELGGDAGFTRRNKDNVCATAYGNDIGRSLQSRSCDLASIGESLGRDCAARDD